MGRTEYKRKPKRVTATTIDEIRKDIVSYTEDDGTVSEGWSGCWLILGDGEKVKCHRKKECKCPNIGDYAVTFVKGDKPFHMTKAVFEDAFIKTSIVDNWCSFFKRMVRRG